MPCLTRTAHHTRIPLLISLFALHSSLFSSPAQQEPDPKPPSTAEDPAAKTDNPPSKTEDSPPNPKIEDPPSDTREAKNHLASSRSPYLLQHADNPVHWFPWSDEAFAIAETENKPVFLSIGYSTCHWCHVMEHESFEDQETADFLNQHFISIKVDREERPDVDRIYMNYQQAVHGHGGWPLNVWLTPDRVPFFSGTYFPKDARPGQTSFISILTRIQESWNLHAEDMIKDSPRILKSLKKLFTEAPAGSPSKNRPPTIPAPDATLLRTAFEGLAASFDPQNGGFGTRPKFPQPLFLGFLLDYRSTLPPENENATRSLKFVETTLRKMADGGIHDHLAGGFHRYSIDQAWHVPHFEKMLYDQALLASAYIDAYQLTRDPLFASVAYEIFIYVETTLSHPGGAFYSAEDADSEIPASHLHLHVSSPSPSSENSPPTESSPTPAAEVASTSDKSPPTATTDPDAANKSSSPPVEIALPQKSEGAFYLWTTDEITDALGDTDAPLFIAAYGLTESGNVPPNSDPLGEFKNKNILHRNKSTADLAKSFGKPEAEIERILAEGRATLLKLRSQRPRPHLDDKILTAWNALMISAYAKAHLVLGSSSPAKSSPPDAPSETPSPSRPDESPAKTSTLHPSPFLARAIQAADFLRTHLYDPENKTLFRSYRPFHATADDYAFLIQALLDLYNASFDTQWLAFAIELQDQQFALLEDTVTGGFFDSPASQTDLILRLKNSRDGARPSANSVSALNLLRLGAIIKSERYNDALEKLIQSFATDLQRDPVGQTVLLTTIARRLQTPAQIVIAGPPDHPGTQAILRLARARPAPNKVIVLLDGGAHSAFLTSKNKLYKAFKPLDGKPTLYLCRNYTCQKPTNNPKEIAAQLNAL